MFTLIIVIIMGMKNSKCPNEYPEVNILKNEFTFRIVEDEIYLLKRFDEWLIHRKRKCVF